LELIHECLINTEVDDDSLESFIVVLHKRTGADALVTRYFLEDLWLLVARREELRLIDETMVVLQPDLRMVTTRLKETAPKNASDVSFVKLDEMLRALYEDRIAQGALPLCWTCLPKVETEGNKLVANRIRKLTRSLADIRWKKYM
jgi:hypothetical protein